MPECPFCTEPVSPDADVCPACGASLRFLGQGAEAAAARAPRPEKEDKTAAAPPSADATAAAPSTQRGDDTAMTAALEPTGDDTAMTAALEPTGDDTAMTSVLRTETDDTAMTSVLRTETDDTAMTSALQPDEAAEDATRVVDDSAPTIYLSETARMSAPCAACGRPFPPEALYCPHCGARRGDVETAASRDETVVVPGAQVRSAAARTWAQTPAADERDEAGQGERGRRGLVIGLVAVVVLAAVAFGVWWFALREAPNGPAPDVAAAMTTILQPVADAQDDTDGSLTRLDAADKGSFAAARAAAAALVSEVTAARTAASGLVIEGQAAAVDQLRAALAAHLAYARAAADLPADPADLTIVAAAQTNSLAEAASSAYEQLDQTVPGLPEMTFSAAAAASLTAAARHSEEAAEQGKTLTNYLQSVVAVFPDSLDARTQAEGIVAQTANGEIQADAAADRMTAESDALTAIVGRIDGLTAPQDQAAQRIQNLYHDAVQHWIAASRLYVRWMKTVWQYYDDQGYYPSPGEGIDASLLQDVDYRAAKSEEDLATRARIDLAVAVNRFAAGLGSPTSYTEASM